jgi:alginate O-acetyltransferase complex protein AlgJ
MLRRAVVIVVGLAFVFGPGVGYALGLRQKPLDNRAIAPAPAASEGFDALDALGPWAADRVAGRSSAVEAKSWFDFNVLHELPANSKVVRGQDGYLFLAEDFTRACQLTPAFQQALDGFAKLAELIERSGRRAVFTIGPNKSSVVGNELPPAVPTGACALDGITQQIGILDSYQHPEWVGVREQLTGSQTYWKTDSHWSTAGAAVFSKALAEHFGPRLGARVTTTPETITKTADLNILLGLTAKETPPSLKVSTGTTVTPQPGWVAYSPYKDLYGKERWTTRPAAGLVPGKSVIVGDSFAYYALGNLRPLFADGTFLWTGHVSETDIVNAIVASDTVVLEIAQRNLATSHIFASARFRQKVAAALGISAG